MAEYLGAINRVSGTPLCRLQYPENKNGSNLYFAIFLV